MDREPGTLRWIDWEGGAGSWEDEAAHRRFVRDRIVRPWPAGMGYWALARIERPDEFLGWVQLVPEAGRGPEIEIGWRLIAAVRGRGYATEAGRAVLTHALGTLGLDRVVADMYRANAASMCVARKLGMREHPDPVRTNADHVLWTIAREDWRR